MAGRRWPDGCRAGLGAAAPWEHTDPGAAAALAACEDQLRDLHLYAMRRFDDLRSAGQSSTAAMMGTVPLFAMHPSTSPRPAP